MDQVLLELTELMGLTASMAMMAGAANMLRNNERRVRIMLVCPSSG